jgi:hypothetical protein
MRKPVTLRTTHCRHDSTHCFSPLPFFQNRQADGAIDRQNRDDREQPSRAELKPAAFAFGRFGFGRLGFHRRIIPDRGQPEQGILADGRGQLDSWRTRQFFTNDRPCIQLAGIRVVS